MTEGGRPREFVEESVLDAALEVFWSQGYAGTTMTHLVKSAGIGRQSLYNAFGDRRAIFLRALDRYFAQQLSTFLEPLERDDATLADVRVVLLRLARQQARGERRGCLLLNSSMELGRDDREVRERTQRYMRRLRRSYQSTVERAGGADPRASAEALVAVTLGVHVMARAGASERAMADAVEGTLARLILDDGV